MPRLKEEDFIGKVYEELTILRFDGFIESINAKKKRKYHAVLCKCSCGKEHRARLEDIRFNRQKGCGCIPKRNYVKELNTRVSKADYMLLLTKNMVD